ncbi:hypothetical protein [Sandaracinus amylolyticus]|uniref:Uncharacterized protein n=1 Tax=Sandaracinus amylolyticus TaxID=927083 RepID=A0A0F6YHZ0_9BACT|nr:hypothetical protein [Sandaracinus amylolyticus]AKF06407.1 hypothetical protein DB32_003556 [Sandaracinus amylolyticus]
MKARIRPSIASLAFLALAALHACNVRYEWRATDALFVACPALAAFACHAPWLGAHVAVRAVAWLHVVLAGLVAILGGRAEAAGVTLLGAVALAALGAHAHESRASAAGFEPIAYRRAFLAATTASFAVAMVQGVLAVGTISSSSDQVEGVVSIVIASGLVASALLVLRLRAAGVLLGIAVAALAIVGACVEARWGREILGPIQAVLWTIAALPALALAAPIAWSRLRPVRAPSTSAPSRFRWSTVLAIVIALHACASALTRASF